MIRTEPSMVMKFVEGLDVFVKFRIFSKENLPSLLKDAQITDRSSYMRTILSKCVVHLPEEARRRLSDYENKREHYEALLYDVCIGLNPDLDIHKVILPVIDRDTGLDELGLEDGEHPCEQPARLNARRLADALKKRVIGQSEAIDAVAAAVVRAQAGLRDPERPVGTFLFLGQTGVGKTELAKALSEELADGDRKALVRIDCSEYSLPHEYAKLIGAPPGYVGHEQGGYLTSVMSEADAAVVLFDEIEKADEKVFNLLLQIMDEGYVTDAKGVKIDFTESMIVLTSNLGATEAEELQTRMGFGFNGFKAISHKERIQATQAAIRNRFKPEFLNRIDETIVFASLGKTQGDRILDKFIGQLERRANERGVQLEVTRAVRDWLLEKGFSDRFGARELRRTVQRELETPIADALVTCGATRKASVKIALNNGKPKIAVMKGRKETAKKRKSKMQDGEA